MTSSKLKRKSKHILFDVRRPRHVILNERKKRFFGRELLNRVETGFVDNARSQNWREHPDWKMDETDKRTKKLLLKVFALEFRH